MRKLEMILVGAPGSGKTALARAFADRSKKWFKDQGLKPLVILDGLPERLAEKAGLELGVQGSHFDSAALYYHSEVRRMAQRKASEAPFLDTMSLVTSIAHVNARLNMLSQLVASPATEIEQQREFMAGHVLTNYLIDRFKDANFGWYTPLPDRIIVPGQDNDTYPTHVDAVLRDMNVKLNLRIPILEGDIDTMVEMMMTDLEDLYDPADDEDTAGVHSAAGEGSVEEPDVSE